jgi:hypothetical protein
MKSHSSSVSLEEALLFKEHNETKLDNAAEIKFPRKKIWQSIRENQPVRVVLLQYFHCMTDLARIIVPTVPSIIVIQPAPNENRSHFFRTDTR